MSRRARALPSTSSDAPSVSRRRTAPGAAERWRALFGCEPPHAAGFIEQAIAWREQVLAQGDVAPAIARDLMILARQAGEGRGADHPHAAEPGEASCSRPPAPTDAPRSNPEDQSAAPRLRSPAQPEAPCSDLEGTATPTPARSRADQRVAGTIPAPLPPASSQLLPGARLVKAHGGRNHVVEVTATGFVYEGQAFASLSAVAKHITGTHWNGLLFFGLRRRKTYPAKAARHG